MNNVVILALKGRNCNFAMWTIQHFNLKMTRKSGAYVLSPCPTNTRRWPNVRLLLVQRLRLWTNITPTLGRRFLFTGIGFLYVSQDDLNTALQKQKAVYAYS